MKEQDLSQLTLEDLQKRAQKLTEAKLTLDGDQTLLPIKRFLEEAQISTLQQIFKILINSEFLSKEQLQVLEDHFNTTRAVVESKSLPEIEFNEQLRTLGLIEEPAIKLSPAVTPAVTFLYNHPNQLIPSWKLGDLIKKSGQAKEADVSLKLHRIEKRLKRKIFVSEGNSWNTRWSLPRLVKFD